jgi:hypothetical protein
MAVNPHADEFDEAEYRLRQDIEQALIDASESYHDSTMWWDEEKQGPRLIETLITLLVLAAKEYRNKLENKEN